MRRYHNDVSKKSARPKRSILRQYSSQVLDGPERAPSRAMELAPGDVGALWLAARCANAARAFQSEAVILEQLIALSEARGADASFYQLYLGQSYARQGLARPALRALQKAAEAPGLSDEQRRELEQEIADIRANPASL